MSFRENCKDNKYERIRKILDQRKLTNNFVIKILVRY